MSISIRAIVASCLIVLTIATDGGLAQASIESQPVDAESVTIARAAAADPIPGPATWDLLSIANWFRAHVGGYNDGARLVPLVWDQSHADTAQNHVNYIEYLRTVGSDYCGHQQDPNFPADGFGNRAHNVLFCGFGNLAYATEGWLATPYHAEPFLDPRSRSVGGAGGTIAAAAGFEWEWAYEIDQPFVFPAPNGVMPRISFSGPESPDPTQNCPALANDGHGEPIYMTLPSTAGSGPSADEYVNYYYRSHELRRSDGTVVASCYLNGVDSLSPGASIFGDSFIFPRRPFVNGERYTVSVSLSRTFHDGADAGDMNLEWSFDVVDYRYPSATRAEVLPDGRVRVTWSPPVRPGDGGTDAVRYTTDGGSTEQLVRLDYSLYDGQVIIDNVPAGAEVRLRPSDDSPWSNPVRIAATVVPVAPARLADTRLGFPTVDGAGAGTGRLSDFDVLRVQVAGRGGVPARANAAMVNLTPVGSVGTGFVTAWSCDGDWPFTSSANYSSSGAANPNMALVPLNGQGEMCVLSSGSTDVAVDVTGYVGIGVGPTLAPVAPARLAETRPGLPTVDGESGGVGRLGPGGVLRVRVAGRGGVPVGANAAMVNLTPVGSVGPGYVTAWSCDGAAPLASSANYSSSGAANPNMALVPLNGQGEMCVFSSGSTDIAVDVTGFVGGGITTTLASAASARLADTRPDSPTVDGAVAGVGRVGPGGVLRVRVAGRGGVPAGAKAAMVNLTPVGSVGPGFVTAWSCDGDPPVASSANFSSSGGANPNTALVPLNGQGEMCIFASGSTNLIADVTGFVASS